MINESINEKTVSPSFEQFEQLMCLEDIDFELLLRQLQKEPNILCHYLSSYSFVSSKNRKKGMESISFTREFYSFLKKIEPLLPLKSSKFKKELAILKKNFDYFEHVSPNNLLNYLTQNKILEKNNSIYYKTTYFEMVMVILEKYLKSREIFFKLFIKYENPILDELTFTKNLFLRWLTEWVFYIWLIKKKKKKEFTWTEINNLWFIFNRTFKLPRTFKTELKFLREHTKFSTLSRDIKSKKYKLNEEYLNYTGIFIYRLSVHLEIFLKIIDINAYFPTHFYQMFFYSCVEEFIFGPLAVEKTFEYLENPKKVFLITPMIIWEHSDSPLIKVIEDKALFKILIYYVPRKDSSSDKFIRNLINNGANIRVVFEEEIKFPSVAIINDHRVQIRPLNNKKSSMVPLGFIVSSDKKLIEKLNDEFDNLWEKSIDYFEAQKKFEALYQYFIKGEQYYFTKQQKQFFISHKFLNNKSLKLTDLGKKILNRYY